MRLGIILAVIGIACYIVHTVLLNRYLRKNAPEVLGRPPREPSQNRQGRVYVTEGASPPWVTLIGIPALPLFLIGIVLITVSLIVKMLR